MDYQGNIAEAFHVTDGAALPPGRNDFASTRGRLRRPPPVTAQPDSASRSAQELLATVCHELRGPVAAVRHAIRLWGSLAPDAAERQPLQAMMERQIRSMTRLIDDLLDVSRVSGDRMRLQCELIDLRQIVAQAIETVASQVDARGHQLVTSAPAEPVWVMGDAFRLEQVFVNLLTNAARYTEFGGRIAIHTDVQDNQAVVRVRDSGIGIAPGLLPHIFDLFQRGDGSDAQSGSGSGLGIGLAIVRSVVELHNGSVTATSSGAGHGSEFTVSLPRGG
jgi:signal transduction histidine kinase